jgi:VTC domain-containing protein
VDEAVDDLLGGFAPASLSELDQRAALLRRVDHKYAVDVDRFRELAGRLADDHEILEVEGRRVFRYRSAYFDTPQRRCFEDHVHDRLPRFKARTTTYEDSGLCVFEVKLTRAEGETDKRQVDHDLGAARRLTPEAAQCLKEALAEAGLSARDDLEHSTRSH